ncbi:MAG: hypothetical protein Q9204_005989 [Flavoplaca sp. TL-2023a]
MQLSRPIVFVAHSLGGTVVKDLKKMLNASRTEVTYLKQILPATHGTIFLGTPHRGSAVASLGKLAQEVTRVLPEYLCPPGPRDGPKTQKIQAWLQPSNFKVQLNEHLDKVVRLDHTISEKPVAKAWLNSYGGVLSIIGPWGYGKTLYAASLIDALSQTSIGSSIVGFAFCRSLAPPTVLRSLIWQICQSDSMTAQQKGQILKAYREFPVQEKGQKPKEEQEILVFRKVYEDMLRSYDHVTLVFDAVDQSGSPDRLVRLATSLANQLFNLNVQS